MRSIPGCAKPAHRCNHCHGSARGHFRAFRKNRDCYDEVRAYVLHLLENPKEKPYGFHKEDLAAQLGVRDHNVEQALARLNQEGLVEQPLHYYPHDNNRSTQMDGGNDSSWVGDLYRVRRCDTLG